MQDLKKYIWSSKAIRFKCTKLKRKHTWNWSKLNENECVGIIYEFFIINLFVP